ncbi:MAG: UDP-2,4-diacetamido-2,4,6-trideoxy-beta-L-altropyranose hydrolase [Rubritalea sp.]|tara:strand:- start:1717 stop:3225 length:1509 start_codon:yes stop_codon:yes gene_type:complete
MNGPILTIRADASHQGGTGHIMRTLAIAQEWISRGGNCTYICASLPDTFLRRLELENCRVERLVSTPTSAEEIVETSTLLQKLKPHWLLIDGYSFTPSYQASLNLPKKTKLAVISDFGCNDFDDPDLAIHSNIEDLVDYTAAPNKTIILSGSDYILIRKEILNTTTSPTPIIPKGKNLLITMGGSDPMEASFLACQEILKHKHFQQLNIKVILGAAYPTIGKMHSIQATNIELISNPSSMGELYQWADTAITSPSTTALELAYCGLPIGLIITADNQRKILSSMLKNNLALQLSDTRGQESEFFQLAELINSDKRLEIASNSAARIDGKGTKRICEAMRLPDINLRPVSTEDAKDLHNWSNDPVTRAASFNSDPIPWDNHLQWLDTQLNSTDSTLLIIKSSTSKLGVVRFNKNAETLGETIISITLAPEFRGLGLAPLILCNAALYYFDNYPQQTITAWIKPTNTASIKSFLKANFVDYPSTQHPDKVRMRLTNTHLHHEHI